MVRSPAGSPYETSTNRCDVRGEIALHPQRAHEPQATPDQRRLVQVSCGWPRAERAPDQQAPAGARGRQALGRRCTFLGLLHGRGIPRWPQCIFLRVLYGGDVGPRGSTLRCPGPRTGLRRAPRDAKGLRPAETLSPFLWGRRGAPPRAAAAEAPAAADRCPRRAKVPKKCTAPPAELPPRYKSPKKVHSPDAGGGKPAGTRQRGAPRAAALRRTAPAARRPSAPRAKQAPRPRAASCAENRPKCICGPEAKRRCAEKRAECIFRQEPPDAQSTLEGRECFPVFSETAGQTGAIAFLARRGGRDAGPNAAAATPESDCPTIHFGRFSAHRPPSGCPKTHCARFSAHLPEAARARSSSTFRKTEFLTTCRPGDRSRSRTRARAAALDVGIFATELRSGRRTSAFACARAPAAPPHPPARAGADQRPPKRGDGILAIPTSVHKSSYLLVRCEARSGKREAGTPWMVKKTVLSG